MEIYVVQSGDTVDSIAENYGISASSIIYNNLFEQFLVDGATFHGNFQTAGSV